jgi:hypothetical protein
MIQSVVEALKAPSMEMTIMRQLPIREMGMMVGWDAYATAGRDTIPSSCPWAIDCSMEQRLSSAGLTEMLLSCLAYEATRSLERRNGANSFLDDNTIGLPTP